MFEDICLDLLHPYQVTTVLETVIIFLEHHRLLLGLLIHANI